VINFVVISILDLVSQQLSTRGGSVSRQGRTMRILWKQLGAFALTVVLIGSVANIAVAGGSSAATA
jgi:hypothetical protein